MNLGGDDWPIFISPKENVGLPEYQGGRRGVTMASNAKGVKVTLKPGDISITFEGGHKLEILKNNTVIYEHKNGPYEGQKKDLKYLK